MQTFISDIYVRGPMVKSIHDIKECPECAGVNLVYNDTKQQVICKDCSMIYEPLTPEAEKKFQKARE